MPLLCLVHRALPLRESPAILSRTYDAGLAHLSKGFRRFATRNGSPQAVGRQDKARTRNWLLCHRCFACADRHSRTTLPSTI
jgi:hypothetical protein